MSFNAQHFFQQGEPNYLCIPLLMPYEAKSCSQESYEDTGTIRRRFQSGDATRSLSSKKEREERSDNDTDEIWTFARKRTYDYRKRFTDLLLFTDVRSFSLTTIRVLSSSRAKADLKMKKTRDILSREESRDRKCSL